MFEILYRLQNEPGDTLKQLINAGHISPLVLHKMEIHMFVNARLTANAALTKRKAVADAAIKFGEGERSIWRALQSMC